MPSLNFDVTALDRASQAFNRIADRIDFLVARLAALNGANASPTVDVDTDPADRTLGRWAIDVRRKLREALATIPTDIELRPNAGAVETTLARIRGEIASLSRERIGIDITGAEALAKIQALKAELEDLDRTGADIEVKADIAAAIAALEAARREAERVDGTDVEIRVHADTKGIKDIINAAALFQRSIKQFAAPLLAIGSIPGLVSLAEELVNLLGLLGLIPGLAFGAVAAIGALAVGFNGFGQALKDVGDPKKFAEDLKSLAPSAQAAAKAFRDLAPAWDKIAKSVQDKLFAGIADQVKALAGVLPTLGAGLGNVASKIGDIVIEWAKWATSAEATQKLGALFENIGATFQNLKPVISDVAQALTDMALVGARLLPDFANGLAGLTGQFRAWIAEITANGQFEQWILRAVDTLNQLGRVAANVWTGLTGLFAAADASGAGFLDTLEKMTAAFSNFANSAQGQNAIIAFFTTMRDITTGLIPGLAALGAAILGAFQNVGPALGEAAKAISAIVTSFSSAIPLLAGVAASLITPIAVAAGALANVLGPLPGIVLAAFVGFKVAPVILGAVATAFTFLAGAADAAGIRILALGAVAGIGGTMTALGTAVGVAATAFRAIATFLTGPFGIAILAAIAVIGLLSTSQDDAAAAADRHASAVQRLQGTLDQTNGAITEATKNQVALDLAQTKLASTGQSLATAIQKNGIAFSDFAAAASGNGVALEKVNAQLVGVAKAQITASDSWATGSKTLGQLNVDLTTLTAAALGNTGAQQKLAEALLPTSKNMTAAQLRAQELVDTYRGELDPALVESAMLLGDQSGALKEAQTVTQQAADAVADWAARLRETKGVLTEFNGLIGANGQWDAAAAGATQLSEAFAKLGEAAQAGARNAARAAIDSGKSIEEAGAAAARSIQQSRDEFLKMADSINIPKDAAKELADILGLIPTAVELNIETNADETQAQLNEIAARLQALPKGTTTLRVEALTADAIQRLEALGIKVEALKDGTFVLHLDDAEFQAKLQHAQDAAKGLLKPFIAFLDLDTAQADAKLNDFKTRGGAGNVAIPISFEHSVADQQLQTLQTQAKTPQVMPVQADIAQAQALVALLQAQARQLQTMPLTADPSQALGVLGALVGTITGTTATMTIAAQNGPALATLGATVGAVNGTTGTMTIAAQNGPALGTLGATKAAVDRTIGTMTIAGNAGPALAAARAAVGAINAMRATITVTTNEIHNVTRNIKDVAASGGSVMRFGQGGIVPGYAPGMDRVPALLSPGEAVLVPEAVKLLGARAVGNLNRLASGGRKMSMVTKTGARAYWSYGTPGGRSGGTGWSTDSSATAGKTYVLNVYNAGNNEIDLREQFRKMEVLGV